MNPDLKAVNTTTKGNWVAIELRARNGHITPAMRRLMRTEPGVRAVVRGYDPTKAFVLLNEPAYALANGPRDELVQGLNTRAAAA